MSENGSETRELAILKDPDVRHLGNKREIADKTLEIKRKSQELGEFLERLKKTAPVVESRGGAINSRAVRENVSSGPARSPVRAGIK